MPRKYLRYQTSNSSDPEEHVDPSYRLFMSKFRSPNRQAPAVYPLVEPLTFKSTHYVQRFSYISDRPQEIMYQLFPHKETLEQLEVEKEVRDLLTHCGLKLLYLDDQGTFPLASIEFFSSFDPVEVCNEYGYDVQMWKFSLEKTDWKISGNQLREWFKFPSLEESFQPNLCTYDVQRIWRTLTKSEEFFPGRDLLAKIKIPVWRMVHMILANTIYMRSDFGASITEEDLRVIALIATREKIEWLGIITETFLEIQKSSNAGQVLEGGSFITHILKMLNISIEGADITKKSLDRERLVAMRVIDENGTWLN